MTTDDVNNTQGASSLQGVDTPREPEPTVNEASDAVGGGGAGGELLKWTFLCDYKRDGKKDARTFLWIEAVDQAAAIAEADEQVKQINSGRLGYMLKGWHDGTRCVEPHRAVAGEAGGGRDSASEQNGAQGHIDEAHGSAGRTHGQ